MFILLGLYTFSTVFILMLLFFSNVWLGGYWSRGLGLGGYWSRGSRARGVS